MFSLSELDGSLPVGAGAADARVAPRAPILSTFSLHENEVDSLLSRALEPLPSLRAAAPTSLEAQRARGGAGASSHVTFKRTVASSGYGSSKPRQPSWAAAAAARARGAPASGGARSAAAAASGGNSDFAAARHPAPTPPLSREDRAAFGVGAPARGAVSGVVFPSGPVACLSFSNSGDALAVGSHGGDVLCAPIAVDAQQSVVASVGARATGLTGRALSVAFSAGAFSVGGARVRATASPVSARGGAGSSAGFAQSERRSGGGAVRGAPGVTMTTSTRLLLSCGEERAAHLWGSGGGAPILSIRSPDGGSAAGDAGAPFAAPVIAATWAHLDRIVLLAAANKLFAMRVALDDNDAADEDAEDATAARRRAAARRYKGLGDWSADASATSPSSPPPAITVLAAPNAWRSPLVFAAFSDRSVRAYDVSVSGSPAEVLRIADAHSRAPHALVCPSASGLCDVGAASLDCIATAAPDGGTVRLWDLRSASCARVLTGGHVSRAGTAGIAISPCATFIATGSDDGACVVYDLRKSEPCARLGGARDAVTAVAWCPAVPRLFAGSLDGGVRAYAP